MNAFFRWSLFAALGLALSGSARAALVFEGVVALPPAKVQASQVHYSQTSGAVAPPDAPRAIVYLEGTFPETAAAPAATATVTQKGYQFTPALLPVLKGATVIFPNLDDDYHHVFSYSKPKEFDLGRFRKDEAPPKVVFDKAGVVKIGCEIHDHMRAVILVLETPYFVKTDETGAYKLSIEKPPAGKFALKAWVDEKTTRTQQVEINGEALLQVNFPAVSGR